MVLSPDGNTLYMLSGTAKLAIIAVLAVSTGSVRRTLSAPAHGRGLVISPGGRRIYEVVGAPGYGNIQVVGL